MMRSESYFSGTEPSRRRRRRPARCVALVCACAVVAAGIATASAGAAAAPETAPGALLRQALAGLDPRSVPTGILYDRVLPLSGIERLDGRPGGPAVPPARWRQALHELRLAAADAAGWPGSDEVRRLARQEHARGSVPLAVLDVTYSRLASGALDSGLLQREGTRLVPAPGVATDQLYVQRRAFAATALEPATFHGGAVTFVLPRRLYVGGDAPQGLRFQLDPGDGAGFRALHLDQPLPAAYTRAGTHRARLRMERDGRVLESAFPIQVRALAAPAPTDTLSLTASIPYEGVTASGRAYLYLATGHAVPVDPVVVVEGFDLDNSMGWDELYALLNQEGLLETLRADGFDAVVLDFTESTEYIQRNAFVLVELLQQVAALSGGHDVAVVGASMGGLVARYALAWMEQQGLPHHARTFISFDAPQNGANIPLGLQYWLDFFQEDSTEAAYLLSRLDTPAARQMLLYHHTSPPAATGTSDALRAALSADLTAVGEWPALPRTVAVANGSGAGVDQGYTAGAQIISYQYSSFYVDIVGNVWAVPDQSSAQIFRGLVDMIWPLPDRSQTVTVSSTLPWDNAPGGYRASMAQMDTTSVTYGDIVALHDVHCFIPTVSALALATADPFFDIAGAGDLSALTPFDAVYFPAANQEHVAVTAENRAWLLAEVQRAPTAASPPAAIVALGPRLLPARPNPFNPRTTLGFALPAGGPVRISLFDVRGRRVRTLLDATLPAGTHEVGWDGRDDAGAAVGSGVYRLELTSGSGRAAGTLTLVR